LSASPYAESAWHYFSAGWKGILPLPLGMKKSPPRGYTGYEGIDPSGSDIEEWTKVGPRNICLRMPEGVIGIDVDDYDGKNGAGTLAKLVDRFGPLPDTWTSSSRGGGKSGVRLYRFEGAAPEKLGPGIEVLRHVHRYLAAWPSIHPEGGLYRWRRPDGSHADVSDPSGPELPRPDALPELPPRWCAHLNAAARAVEDRATLASVTALPGVVLPTTGTPSPPPSPHTPLPPGSGYVPLPALWTTESAAAYCRQTVDALAAAQPGDGRNALLNGAAFAVGHFVGDWVSSDALERVLYEAATANGHVAKHGRQQTFATIRSGLRAGMREPYAVMPPEHNPAPSITSPADAVAALIAELVDTDGLDSIPDPVPVVEGWLYADSLAWLIGKPGSGKSFVALDIAASVGTARTWHGCTVQGGTVVYLVAEGLRGIRKRVRAWEAQYQQRMTNVLFLPRPIQVASQEWAVLTAACEQIKPALIIGDTQARLAVGIDENDNTEMGVFIDRMEKLRQASGACVMLVHHTGKDGAEGRGASAVKAALQTEIRAHKESDRVIISCGKQKDDAEPEDMALTMRAVSIGRDAAGMEILSVFLEGDPLVESGIVGVPQNTRWDKLLEGLPQNRLRMMDIMANVMPYLGGTAGEIRTLCRAHGMTREECHKAFDDLVAREVVVRVQGTQRWILRSEAERLGRLAEEKEKAGSEAG